MRFAVGRPELVVRAGGKRSERLGAPPSVGGDVKLRRAVLGIEKRDPFPIWRPAGPLARAVVRQLPGVAVRDRYDPDIVRHVIGVVVGRRDVIGDPLVVGRNLGIAQAVHRDQVLERDRDGGRAPARVSRRKIRAECRDGCDCFRDAIHFSSCASADFESARWNHRDDDTSRFGFQAVRAAARFHPRESRGGRGDRRW